MLWSLFIFVITISILITVHECGHFFAARLCGVKVSTFSIGFGNKLYSYQGRETQFKISLIPLGGYVKMLDSRFESVLPQELNRAFDKQSILKRAFILASGPLANFIFGFILYWMISLIGISTLIPTIAQVQENSPAFVAGLQPNQTIVKVNHEKVQNWSEINQKITQALNKNAAVTFELNTQNQSSLNKMLAPPYLKDENHSSALARLGIIPEKLQIHPVIGGIVADSAAQQAKLQVNDRFIAYKTSQEQVATSLASSLTPEAWSEFVQVIHRSPVIFLEIERKGHSFWQKIDLKPTHQTQSPAYSLGIYPKDNTILIKYSIISGSIYALEATVRTIDQIVFSFYQLVIGQIGLEHLSGPLSIAQAATTASEYGFVSFLGFFAFISLSLGVVNLIPLPALDGGQLLLLLIEKIKGTPLSSSFQLRFFQIGIVIIIAIMGISLFNDFSRI